MNFKRNDVQEYIEFKCGCADITKWDSYKQKLRELNLSVNDIADIRPKIEYDAVSYWLKAIHSFTQALEGISAGYSAWSIVKLYYSVFYCLRGELLSNSYLLIRNGSLFCLNLNTETQFSEFRLGKLRGDHQLTIGYYSTIVKDGAISDLVSSNQIDDNSPYMWMLKQRERVNYQMQVFPDPRIDRLLDKTHKAIIQNKIDALFNHIDSSINSDGVYLFDKDYSMISIPYYKLQVLLKHIQRFSIDLSFITGELEHIISVLQRLSISDETIERLVYKNEG
ncbi:hypothetical protein [Bacteroides caecigallinarum]|uniref:hypothetical protein n=1 Tax=Bacteroides caecigallinarum TaxID=1411144 RepID=UPI001F2CD6FE|nr:hypothetical protein [Bacteroides caecigallinarum]MCF2582638.1 hypothetical protein [Bacteroides caecigallinarum]